MNSFASKWLPCRSITKDLPTRNDHICQTSKLVTKFLSKPSTFAQCDHPESSQKRISAHTPSSCKLVHFHLRFASPTWCMQYTLYSMSHSSNLLHPISYLTMSSHHLHQSKSMVSLMLEQYLHCTEKCLYPAHLLLCSSTSSNYLTKGMVVVVDQGAFYYISTECCYIQPNSVTVTLHVTCDSVTSTLLLEDDY